MDKQSSHAAPSVLDFVNPELDASTWGMEHVLKTLLTYQIEGMRFAAKRTLQNLEFMRRLRHCADAQQMMQLLQKWVSDETADYAEEWGRMLGTGVGLATTLDPIQGLTCRPVQTAGARRVA